MTKILQAESTLTDKYQTTVPNIVRKTLGLAKRDKIVYVINSDGTVTLKRCTQSEADPILSNFLDFLAQDMESNPQNIQSVSTSTYERILSLVGDIELDLETPLSDEDE